MVFLVRRRGAENIEKRKQAKEKHWKMKRKKSEKQKESQITTTNIFGFTFYMKNYILLESIAWKTAVYSIAFYLQVFGVAGYLKRSKDASKRNM